MADHADRSHPVLNGFWFRNWKEAAGYGCTYQELPILLLIPEPNISFLIWEEREAQFELRTIMLHPNRCRIWKNTAWELSHDWAQAGNLWQMYPGACTTWFLRDRSQLPERGPIMKAKLLPFPAQDLVIGE